MCSTPRALCLLVSLGLVVVFLGCAGGPDTTARPHLFVAETSGRISVFAIDAGTGALAPKAELAVVGPMQFLAFHPDAPFLYAVAGDRLQGFALDPVTAAPRLLGEATVGARGTHLELDRTGRWAFVASYGGDLVAMLPLGDDGVPGPPKVVLGGAGDPEFCRRAHQVRVHPNNRFVYAPCLGSDHVAVLAFDAGVGSLDPLATAPLADGAGPRHMDFHPSLDVVYVLNELDSTVAVFGLEPATGRLTPMQSISALPAGVTEASRSSDVHVGPGGRFLYAINREPLNNIAVFAIGGDGRLRAVAHVPTGGDHARTFSIDPAGQFLFVGNSRSQSVVTFRIGGDGGLTEVGRLADFSDPIWFVGVRGL